MTTREHRISEFNSGEPPTSEAVEILCEDHCGTYVPPFACRWKNGTWVGAPTNEPIQATVLGWRSIY